MQMESVVQEINFHDSNIIELLHEKDKVKIKMDICMWKQKGYKEGDDELKEIVLEFEAIEDYIWDSDKTELDIDYDTILEFKYNNGKLKIVMMDDGVSVVVFKCNNVNIT